MSLTITVAPDVESRIREYAARVGKPAEEVGQIALFRFVHAPYQEPTPQE